MCTCTCSFLPAKYGSSVLRSFCSFLRRSGPSTAPVCALWKGTPTQWRVWSSTRSASWRGRSTARSSSGTCRVASAARPSTGDCRRATPMSSGVQVCLHRVCWCLCRRKFAYVNELCCFRCLQADTWRIVSGSDDKTLKVCFSSTFSLNTRSHSSQDRFMIVHLHENMNESLFLGVECWDGRETVDLARSSRRRHVSSVQRQYYRFGVVRQDRASVELRQCLNEWC